jgi:hypothetical protein
LASANNNNNGMGGDSISVITILLKGTALVQYKSLRNAMFKRINTYCYANNATINNFEKKKRKR